MLKKYWPLVLIFSLTILASFISVISSDHFRYCVDNGGQYPRTQNVENESATIGVPGGLQLYWNCTGYFANENGVAITALATVLLTVVTGGLVWLGFMQYSTTRAQLRAYIYPDKLSFKIIGEPHNTPVVLAGFKNFGQTPATKVVNWAQIDVIEPRHESTLVVPVLEERYPTTIGAAGEYSKTTMFVRVLNAQDLADIQSGQKAIYYYGRVEYTDTFGIRHSTNFRASYSGVFPNPAGVFTTSAGGNEAD